MATPKKPKITPSKSLRGRIGRVKASQLTPEMQGILKDLGFLGKVGSLHRLEVLSHMFRQSRFNTHNIRPRRYWDMKFSMRQPDALVAELVLHTQQDNNRYEATVTDMWNLSAHQDPRVAVEWFVETIVDHIISNYNRHDKSTTSVVRSHP